MTEKKLDVTAKINEVFGITESYKAPDRLWEILRDKAERERIFADLLEYFDYDVGFDWFHEYFQDEHADRATKKQDFTPMSVATLVSSLIGDTSKGDGQFYEPAAGTGGMTIVRWDADRRQHSPFHYRPSDYVYTCEELSDRAMPFLLFNVILRGMNAIIVHCDVLSRKAYGAFFVQNSADNHMGFSDLHRLPYNDDTAQTLAINFIGERYGEFDAVGEWPAHLADVKAVAEGRASSIV